MRDLEAIFAEAMPRNPRHRGGLRRDVAWKLRGVVRLFQMVWSVQLAKARGR